MCNTGNVFFHGHVHNINKDMITASNLLKIMCPTYKNFIYHVLSIYALLQMCAYISVNIGKFLKSFKASPALNDNYYSLGYQCNALFL